MKRTPVIIAFLLALCANISEAHAERLGIFVRVTDSDERPIGIDQLALLEQLATHAEFARGLTVVRTSELLTSDVRRSVIECGEKLACIASKLTITEIDLGLLATIDASSDPALVLVLLIDARNGKLLGRAIEEAPRNDAESIAYLADTNALRLLADAGHAVGGRAIVRATPSDANIHFTGPAGDAHAKPDEKISLSPGKWVVEISKDGFVAKSVELEVEAGKDREVTVALEPESSLLASPWLWIGAGAAVVGAVIITFAVTQHESGPALIPGDDGMIHYTLRAGE